MHLIYNCGRLRAKGYATFLGACGKAKIAAPEADLLWQAVERGSPRPGSTGIVRKLAAEGREIVEVLVLDHGHALTATQAATLQAALGKFFDRELAAALQAANAPTVSHAAAQATIDAALASALPALARQIPPAAPRLPAARPPPTARSSRKMAVLVSGIAALLLLVGGGWLALHTSDDPAPPASLSQETPAAPSQETTAAVQDFLRACHGEPDPALVTDLAMAFTDLAPVAHVDGLRAPLQLLGPAGSEALPDLSDLTDTDICAKRQALWQALETLRPHVGRVGDPPYQDALVDLAVPTEELALPRLAQTASQAEPPPAAPPDCARNKCFPILHPDDLVALAWIDGLYLALAAELAGTADAPASRSVGTARLTDFARDLRAAEVRFRGELALVGISANQPQWLKLLWNCEGRDHLDNCSFALAEISAWARR
jgi:hypothetical protein